MRDKREIYEIRVGCHVDESWSELFEGLSLRNDESGEAVLTIPAGEQALLHGVLTRIRDFNLTLISVCQLGSAPGRQE